MKFHSSYKVDNKSDYSSHLKQVIDSKNFDSDESSINLAFSDQFLKESTSMAESYKSEKLKFIFIIGIGGSNLGTMAIYKAIFKDLDYLNSRMPKIVFIETTSQSFLDEVEVLIKNQVNSKEEFVLNLISKSGSTVETISLFEYLNNVLNSKFGNIDDRIVVTTDYNSQLDELSKAKGFKILNLPKKVGGRFSVFSNVGLFPLALVGLNVSEILRGAKDILEISLNSEENFALQSAMEIHSNFQQGKSIYNHFIFNQELEYFGKWYRQLLGESVGKEFNKNNEKVNLGITPIVSIGSTDLHSMAQLYFGGPNDKLTTFVYSSSSEGESVESSTRVFPEISKMIDGKSMKVLMDSIYQGVKNTYVKLNLSHNEIVLDEINEYNLGKLLQFKMLEVMYLGNLFNVNTFDQPNVEEYKIETKTILESK